MRRLAATLGALSGWLPVAPVPAAAAAPAGLEAADIFRLEYASDPRVAPDGRSVVFVREVPDVGTDEWYSNLWIVPTEGGPPRPLTRGLHHDVAPRWSPDGGRLAFVSDRGGTPQIYLLRLADGDLARLTDVAQPPAGLAWSPDGRRLSFAALEPRPPPAIAELPRPPPGATWAEPPRIIDRLVYRTDPDGYQERGFLRLYVVPAAGGTPRRVTRGAAPFHEVSPDPLHFESDPEAAVWTPDGRYLIVSANRKADWELAPLDTELYEISLADGSARALTDRRGPDATPAVSPDGRRIAYLGFDDRGLGYQIARLYVIERDGGEPRTLTAKLDRNVQSPRWTHDSSGLLFRYHDRGNTRIAHVDLEGNVTELSGNVGSGYSTYGGGSFTLSRTGLYAFTYSRPEVPVEVAVASVDDPRVRLLTALNRDLLGAKELGEVEELWFTSAGDRRRIQGWIVKPPGFEAARRYPLIVDIHGGPFRDYGARFDVEKQIWAARGYLVLYVNQRGSAGYGEEFANLIHHAYPGDDLDDLRAALDAVVERGWADPENLFVTGGSGGALVTCWWIAESDRFRAAVAAYPLVDWTSFALTTDISARVIRYWFPGPPWEHPGHYRDRSPLSRVAEVETPTMLVVGEHDYRTLAAEAEKFYAALKYRGVATTLVRLAGEPHFAERHPSHQIDRVLLTLGWFDRYLRGVDAATEAAKPPKKGR